MRKLFLFLFLCFCFVANAQIGYQVALLNSATGEPRANVTVNVNVKLTGADGSVIVNQTQDATTNDLGLLSLTIGDSKTFEDVDWKKALPLSVSVTADGILVASSEVLTVPVAEYAKTAGDVLTDKMLVGTWNGTFEDENMTYTFKDNGSGVWKKVYGSTPSTKSGKFFWDRDGSWIIIILKCDDVDYMESHLLKYSTKFSSLIGECYEYKKIN